MKIRIRFIAIFSLGLLAFSLCLSYVYPFLLDQISPNFVWVRQYNVDPPSAAILYVLIYLMCFAVGGCFFSILVVRPFYKLAYLVDKLSTGNLEPGVEALRHKDGSKFRWPYALYHEAFANIQVLADNLQAAQEERRQLERAKRDWMAGIGHDIKTPLAYITGYASLLMNKDHDWTKEELQTYLGEIYQKGVYIEGLLGDMNQSFYWEDLQDVKLEAQPANLGEFLQRLVADVASLPQAAHHNFSMEAPDREIVLPLDSKQMYRALENIYKNSIDHNPPGTEITTVVCQNNGQVTITISDNGTGMEPEAVAVLFDRYASRIGKGRGLGLYIAHNIIAAHGGTAQVESELGNGTKFIIGLPIDVNSDGDWLQ